jgi:hypothetical protein
MTLCVWSPNELMVYASVIKTRAPSTQTHSKPKFGLRMSRPTHLDVFASSLIAEVFRDTHIHAFASSLIAEVFRDTHIHANQFWSVWIASTRDTGRDYLFR